MEGFSPFEGAADKDDWLQLLQERFEVRRKFHFLMVTHYLSGPEMIRLPDRFALPILHGIAALERWLFAPEMAAGDGAGRLRPKNSGLTGRSVEARRRRRIQDGQQQVQRRFQVVGVQRLERRVRVTRRHTNG